MEDANSVEAVFAKELPDDFVERLVEEHGELLEWFAEDD